MSPVRVLHVDDEADMREIVSMSLELDPGFSVMSCASGGEAIAAAGDLVPDIVLLDAATS